MPQPNSAHQTSPSYVHILARMFVVCLVLLSFAMAVAAARAPTTVAVDHDAANCDSDLQDLMDHDAANCDSDLQDLMANCQDYLKFPAEPKITPSPACCALIQRANIPCLCAKVTPQVEQFVCMDKVVFVAASCKRPFKAGSNCGSYHVPGVLG